MRTLERDCAGLQDGPVHVLLKISHYAASKSCNKKEYISVQEVVINNHSTEAGATACTLMFLTRHSYTVWNHYSIFLNLRFSLFNCNASKLTALV
jgi:hypothetical protein